MQHSFFQGKFFQSNKTEILMSTLDSPFKKRQKCSGGECWCAIICNTFPFLQTVLRTNHSQFSQGGLQRKTLSKMSRKRIVKDQGRVSILTRTPP